MVKHTGIDISEWQGDINLKSLRPEFVIIRAGDGDYWDAQLSDNIRKCQELNIPYGLYWFLRDHDTASADKTARALCAFANGQYYTPTMGIWCDVEDPEEWNYNAANAIDPARAFCQAVENMGYYAGIYCNWDFYGKLYPALSAFDTWLADWDDTTEDTVPGTMKQYSNSDGKLDLDVCFVDLRSYSTKGQIGEQNNDIRKYIDRIREILNEMETNLL